VLVLLETLLALGLEALLELSLELKELFTASFLVVLIGVSQTLELDVGELVTGGHEVVHVDGAQESFDAAALGLGLIGHSLGDLARVSVDTGNYRNDGSGKRRTMHKISTATPNE